MPLVEIRNLTKRFGNVTAIDDVFFTVKAGHLAVLLGPSGCGKTTTLRCVAGLEKPDAGEILLGDEIISSAEKNIFVPPDKRGMGMVFQSYALWPHKSVFDNIAYPLKVKGKPKEEVHKAVKKVLEIVSLVGLEKRYPSQLSGGQQQRVALARSLVSTPRVLLLDEPLSNLDAKLRASTRYELRDLIEKLGITTIYVTHDQLEAMALADKVFIMNNGKLVQEGIPRKIYKEPESKFVAGFIGSTNLIDCSIVESEPDPRLYTVRTKEGLILHAFSGSKKRFVKGNEVIVSIRQEDIDILERPLTTRNRTLTNIFECEIKRMTFFGDHLIYLCAIDGMEINAKTNRRINHKIKPIYLRIDPENCLLLSPED